MHVEETAEGALETVAPHYGLEKSDAPLLQLQFSETILTPKQQLTAEGMCDESQCHVLGVEAALPLETRKFKTMLWGDRQHGFELACLHGGVQKQCLAATCRDYQSATANRTQALVIIGALPVKLFEWGPGRLYLSLKYPNSSSSFGWKGGAHAVTHWYRLRVEPTELIAHTGDFTFSRNEVFRKRSDGATKSVNISSFEDVVYENVVVGESVPYATCLDCSRPSSHKGKAVIDLRDTPFSVKSEFAHDGYKSAGDWKFKHNRQQVLLSGGGCCGYCGSKEAVDQRAVDDHPGGWYLHLQIAK